MSFYRSKLLDMDEKVEINGEKEIFGRIQNNVYRSKTIWNAEGQGMY